MTTSAYQDTLNTGLRYAARLHAVGLLLAALNSRNIAYAAQPQDFIHILYSQYPPPGPAHLFVCQWHCFPKIFQFLGSVVPIAIAAILGTCIALLLAFRTNQAYDRWWEARIAWGAIVNDSRSLIRQLQLFVANGPDRDSLLHAFVERQCAFCFVLGDTLRRQDVTERLQQFLSVNDSQRVAQATNKPNALLLEQGLAMRSLYDSEQLTDYQLVQLSTTLNNLTDSMGRCERIKNTVFPRTYTFNMQVFIYLFATILPFCLDPVHYLLDVPLVTLLSSAFILIEKSAIQLQDPFENKPTDTPMTSIAQTIEIDLKSMTAYSPLPDKQIPQTYYSL